MTAEDWIASLQANPALAGQLDDLVKQVSERDLKQRRAGARTAVAHLASFLREEAHKVGGDRSVWLRNVIDLIHKEGKKLEKIMAKWESS
jgi:hypothetical protein